MQEQIIITIEPHEDGVRCGECHALTLEIDGQVACAWSERQFGAVYKRGPDCLAAARTLREEREAARRVIEAGQEMALHGWSHGRSDIFWDAVRKYEAARGEGR